MKSFCFLFLVAMIYSCNSDPTVEKYVGKWVRAKGRSHPIEISISEKNIIVSVPNYDQGDGRFYGNKQFIGSYDKQNDKITVNLPFQTAEILLKSNGTLLFMGDEWHKEQVITKSVEREIPGQLKFLWDNIETIYTESRNLTKFKYENGFFSIDPATSIKLKELYEYMESNKPKALKINQEYIDQYFAYQDEIDKRLSQISATEGPNYDEDKNLQYYKEAGESVDKIRELINHFNNESKNQNVNLKIKAYQ